MSEAKRSGKLAACKRLINSRSLLLPFMAAAAMTIPSGAYAQAVNVGNVGGPKPHAPRDNHPRGGVEMSTSPGNSIVTDGQTRTHIRTNGNTTDITTRTMSGGNAFNSFSTFSEGQGNVVNLIVPDKAGQLVNVVRNGPVNIQGILNSYQNGKIGGNVVFADSYGMVVGAKGSVNVGGLTIVTPTKAIVDQMISGGVVNQAVVAKVLAGNVPLSPDGSVSIAGRINAEHYIAITANDVRIAGSLDAARKVAEQKAEFQATVNTENWQGNGHLVSRNGRVSIESTRGGLTNPTGSTTARTRSTREPRQPDGIAIRAAKSVVIDPKATLTARSSAKQPAAISIHAGEAVSIGGKLNVDGAAKTAAGKIDVTSDGSISIAQTAVLRASGVGKASDAGAIKVKSTGDLTVENGATFLAHGGTTGNGGFVELSSKAVATVGSTVVDLDLR